MTRVCLGRIMGAHGVKGLVRILPFGEDASLIGALKPLYTAAQGNDVIALTLKNQQGEHWLASVDAVMERDGAENLRGTALWVDKTALPKIAKANTYYQIDLIGLAVIDEQGEKIGTLLNVLNYGSADLLEIQLQSGGSCIIPFKDEYVPSVDVAKGEIRVRAIEDFMEL